MAPLNQVVGQDFGDALEAPALKPPSGVVPNFANPPNQNVYAYLALILGVSLASIVALLRVYARLFYLKVVHLADYIGLAAFGVYLALVYELFNLLNTTGFFVHQWDLHVKDLIEFNRLFTIATQLYCVTIATIKSAIIVEWVFIFVPSHTRNYFYWISYIVLWLHLLFYLAIIIFLNTACHPHDKLWNPLLPGTCVKTTFTSALLAAVNLTVDLTLFILPQRVIWGLQMSFKKRLGVSLIFILGILAIISASFKVSAAVPYNASNDTTYSFAALVLWSFSEASCGIIIFCLPSIPKALGSLSLSEVTASLKSWAGASRTLLHKTRSASTGRGPWSGVSSKPSDSSMRDHVDAQHSEKGSDIQEDDAASTSAQKGIVRTTYFTASETHDNGNGDSNSGHLRQHPWIPDH
ncbi:hypothetical protein O1611_g1846 [Lasiodiplodia mahajangana]|uniref:Uncharacterized protein n=1 Tax=Lasiodiplodia mahajangana TaxID=1108764 RepID=A0ACC2JW90_9PEZI|nr:hypothetical protein O1611_g1846 [Lasiodiplodia mahajangana]